MKKQKKNSVSKGMVRLCAHTIEWWLNGCGLQLSDMDTDHITSMLIENYVEGELCILGPNDKEVWGWWKIQM